MSPSFIAVYFLDPALGAEFLMGAVPPAPTGAGAACSPVVGSSLDRLTDLVSCFADSPTVGGSACSVLIEEGAYEPLDSRQTHVTPGSEMLARTEMHAPCTLQLCWPN